MSKKVLVISTSLRKGSNSAVLAEEFAKGAKAAGHVVEEISLCDKTIAFCKGCLACQTTHHCVIKDDANEITEKMLTADIIAFATPIYYYGMSGQMKVMLDRANSLYDSEYAFRKIYLLATAADSDKHAVDGAVTGINGWISCFEKAQLTGVVFGGGINDANKMREYPDYLKQAYEMGKNS